MPISKRTRLSKPSARTRVTNGVSLFPEEVDGRTYYARRLRDLIALHSADLGGGDHLSEAEHAIVRRASVITIALEGLELKFAQSSDPALAADLDLYQRMSNTLNRLLKTIGIKRKPRDVTPDLQTYLRQKAAGMTIDDAPRANGRHRMRAQ